MDLVTARKRIVELANRMRHNPSPWDGGYFIGFTHGILWAVEYSQDTYDQVRRLARMFQRKTHYQERR